MKIKLFCRKPLLGKRQWYFRIVAANGEIIAQSEGYNRRKDALHTAELLRQELPQAEIHDA